jgi:uncharacterized protein DUF695
VARGSKMKHVCLGTLVVFLWLCGCNGGRGTFTVLQRLKNGHPLFATIDTSLRDGKVRAGFPWFLSLSTPILHPTKDGLTTDGEASTLNDWEDSLEKQLSGECRFVYVGRVTWNGTRELLYYVDRPGSIVPKLEKLAQDGSRRQFTVRYEHDEQWKQVSSYFE